MKLIETLADARLWKALLNVVMAVLALTGAVYLVMSVKIAIELFAE